MITLSLTGLLLLILIAGICGAIGRSIAGGTRGGFIVSITVGFLGALVGSSIAHSLRLPELWTVVIDRHPFPILWSIVGAAVSVAAVHLVSGAYSRRHYS